MTGLNPSLRDELTAPLISPQIPALLCADKPTASTELHIFRNMLERAYGSEAYLRTVDDQLGLNLNWMSPIHFLPIFL